MNSLAAKRPEKSLIKAPVTKASFALRDLVHFGIVFTLRVLCEAGCDDAVGIPTASHPRA